MNEKLITIIIPIYNAEKYVKECLESVLNQTYSNLEIIAIDDGSKDTSLAICNSFQDKRLIVIHKENEGLARTRELGLSMIKGEYYVTIDADDYLEKEYIERLYCSISLYGADIALCARRSFKNGIIEEFYLDKKICNLTAITNQKLSKNYYNMALQFQMSDSWNKMYRTSFVKNSDVHFDLPRQYNGTDLLFNYKLLLHAPSIVGVNEILYNYRIVDNSIVHRKDKKLYKGFEYIHNQLVNESNKLNLPVSVRHQIDATYIEMLKYSSLDIYQDSISELQMLTNFEEMKNTIRHYKLTDFWKIECILSINVKIFFALLNYGNVKSLVFFYRIRKLLRKSA